MKKAEQAGNIREVCRLHNSTEQTFYRWRNKFGEMEVSEAKKLREIWEHVYSIESESES